MTQPLSLPARVGVVNVGLPLFGDAIREQGAPVVSVDWRVPAGGQPAAVAALGRGIMQPRLATANRVSCTAPSVMYYRMRTAKRPRSIPYRRGSIIPASVRNTAFGRIPAASSTPASMMPKLCRRFPNAAGWRASCPPWKLLMRWWKECVWRHSAARRMWWSSVFPAAATRTASKWPSCKARRYSGISDRRKDGCLQVRERDEVPLVLSGRETINQIPIYRFAPG